MVIDSKMSKIYYRPFDYRGISIEMEVDDEFQELVTKIKIVDSSTGKSFKLYNDKRDISIRDMEDVRTAVHEARMYLEDFFDDLARMRSKILDDIDEIAGVLIPKYNK